jgi:hypothetical protein
MREQDDQAIDEFPARTVGHQLQFLHQVIQIKCGEVSGRQARRLLVYPGIPIGLVASTHSPTPS